MPAYNVISNGTAVGTGNTIGTVTIAGVDLKSLSALAGGQITPSTKVLCVAPDGTVLGHVPASLLLQTISDEQAQDAVGGIVRYSIEYNDGTPYIQLVGDVASPGNNKVYGTNGSGVRGWYDAGGGGGGGGSPWDTNTVNDALSSLTNVSGVSGTWAISGGVLQHTQVTGGFFEWAKYNTATHGPIYAQCEVRIPTQGTTDPHAGLVVRYNGTDTNSSTASQLAASLWYDTTNSNWKIRAHRSNAAFADPYTFGGGAYDTWVTLGIGLTGGQIVVEVNGTRALGGHFQTPADGTFPLVGFVGLGTTEYRNLTVKPLVLP